MRVRLQEKKTSSLSATDASDVAVASNVDDLDDLVPADEVDDHAGQHKDLKLMCVMDCHQEQRIIPNGKPADLENDCFTGQVMLLVRTPDVDDNNTTGMADFPQLVSSYFKGKKRRFEFQFQIKLKRVPHGPLFLGCELEHSIKVGSITRGLVGILLAMVRRINPGFHYSWGPDKKLDPEAVAEGNYEKTHLSFPVEASMDRIVITKPGETPPQLGTELYESPESVKRRRRMGAGSVDWNLEDTYTMCLWSAYCDWMKWKSLNVPGVAPFSLARVTGTQPIYLSVYEITSCDNEGYRKKRPGHLRKDLNIYTRLEFSNSQATVGGLAGKVGIIPNSSRRILSSEMSLPDTESVDSDFESTSHITAL